MGITARFLWNLACGFRIDWYSPCNLAELCAAIEMEFETLHATPDFARRVYFILRNRCLACIAEGG